MRPAALSDIQKAEAVALYTSGAASARAIARALGVSPNTVRDAILNNGRSLDKKSHFISTAALGRTSPMKGVTRSADSIAKQVRSKRENGLTPRVGYKHSAETIAKISFATKGKNVRFAPEEKIRRERVRQACKRFLKRVLQATGSRKTTPTQCMLGYSAAELSAHLGALEAGDHIDHIVPVAEFFRRGIYDPAIINALPNLQVLSADENRRKGAKVPGNAEEIIGLCLAAGKLRGEVLTATFAPGGVVYTRGIA